MSRRRKFIINAFFWAIIVALIFLVFLYLLGMIWPFFLAFVFAWVMTPIIRWLTAKCHLKHSLSVALCLIVFFALVGMLIVAVTINVVSLIQDFIVWLPRLYVETIEPAMANGASWVEDMAERLGPEAVQLVEQMLPNVISSVGSAVTSLSMRAVAVVSGLVTKLPTTLLYTLICAIATVFMTLDFPRITSFLMRQFPERPRHIISKAKETFVVVIVKYGKSYGIIMCITFVEILVGMLILRQNRGVLIALLIAVFDIFPVVGAGLILIPWSVISLLSGSIAKGLGLFALWVIVTIIRQIIEPRIVGHQVGLHPLVTLIAMIVGARLFGGIGLLGLPIACAIIRSLDDAGVITVIRKETDVRPAQKLSTPPPEEKS